MMSSRYPGASIINSFNKQNQGIGFINKLFKGVNLTINARKIYYCFDLHTIKALTVRWQSIIFSYKYQALLFQLLWSAKHFIQIHGFLSNNFVGKFFFNNLPSGYSHFIS